jgi:disulfide bond formation protein DsbB
MIKLNKISEVAVAAIISLVALASALVSQYIFTAAPCDLCIYQRYPYIFIIGIALISKIIKAKKLTVNLIIIGFFATASIAIYHVGVEQGLVNEPTSCATGSLKSGSLEELRAAILNAPKVSCKDVKISFLGLSMAAWNAIYALCAIFIVRKIWRKQQRN